MFQFRSHSYDVETYPAKIQRDQNGQSVLRLDAAFHVYDSKKRKWTAPKGTIADGASIPEWALSAVGCQFSEDFLDAAVNHDAYCGEANEKDGASFHQANWQDVHRMFYDACIKCGTSPLKASLMYAAVYVGGPDWDDPDRGIAAVPQKAKVSCLKACAKWIESERPPIEEITKWMKEVEPSLREGKTSAGDGK